MDWVGKEEDGVKGGRTREGLERCGLIEGKAYERGRELRA